MSYFRLVNSRAFGETRVFWNIHRIWNYLAVPISGFMLRLLVKGTRQVSGWHEIALFVFFGLVVSWAGTYCINLIRIPAILHREQAQTIDTLAKDKSALQGEVESLKKPKRPTLEQKIYEEIKDALEKYGDGDEKVVLRFLIRNGKMTEHHSAGLSPIPPGFSRERALKVLLKLEADQIVVQHYEGVPGGWARTWQISPGVEATLKELI